MEASVRHATALDVAPAADTLAAAFQDYPWTRWVIPEDGYMGRLHRLQSLCLEHARQHGVVMVAESCRGVLALLPPDAPEPDSTVTQEIVELHGSRINRLTESAPVPGAWVLATLGVDPRHQGRGLGCVLIRQGIDAVTAQGAQAVVLQTSDQRNVDLYHRHGFHTVSHNSDGPGPHIWSMERRL